MLNLRKVLGAKPKEHVEATLTEMLTPWGEELDPRNVLQEHPMPQFERELYQVLNGRWSCAFCESGHSPTDDLARVVSRAPVPASGDFDQQIVVPFSPEAPLSGVRRQLQPDELLWYRCTVRLPELNGHLRCILHFQAVDYACACRVNGRLVGTHVGGYTPFAFDITDFLDERENELLVCVADPSEFGGRLRGKQRFDRGDIWYTAQSGIWQTVWLEVVPGLHLESAQIQPDAETGILVAGAHVAGIEAALETMRKAEHAAQAHGAHAPSAHAAGTRGAHAQQLPPLRMEVFDDGGTLVAQGECETEAACAVAAHVPDPHLWSPDDPYLYRVRFTLGEDIVESYCAFRTVELRVDDRGSKRVFLNGEPLFVKGVLDQAYWSDGLMTAPSDDALIFDIEEMRAAGFNLMRKHIKVESERWYYHCDRLGMLVLQDMVSGGDPEIKTWDWSYKPTLFKYSWKHFRDDVPSHYERLGAGDAGYREEWAATARETIGLLGNHPSIIGWSLFNEGWGQFESLRAFEVARALDPSRVIDAVSGWYDMGYGDFYSVHNYFRTLKVWRCRRGRASFVSEFGGYSHRVEGHSSLDECYGYEVYENMAEWRAAVRELLAHMDSLEDEGLAGYVYTQVSDIEEETNGILTYDRRMNKLLA